MISDEPLHVTCVGAWEGAWLVLLGLLRLTQIALLFELPLLRKAALVSK